MKALKYFSNFIFLAAGFFSINLSAAILKHDISQAKNHQFSFREMCEAMGSKNLELITAKSSSELDCMGKFYKSTDFCVKKFPLDKTLTRGIVDGKNKKIICESSPGIMISVSCDERDLKYCFNPKDGCEELRKIYAYKLEIAHFSMLEKNLNCYFSKKLGDELNEP